MMTISIEQEEEFYQVQRAFLACRMNAECTDNLVSKDSVGDHDWYHTPTAEYLGDRYGGVVIVAARPAMPKNRSYNPEMREKILAFLAEPTLARGRDMNATMAKFVPNFVFVRTGEANFDKWGLEGRLDRVAFLNIYKCRVTEGARDSMTVPYILEPCVRNYLDQQMKILKPRLIVYHWPYVHEALTRLKELDAFYDPTYNTEFCVGPDDAASLTEKQVGNAAIKKRIETILVTY